MCASAEATSPKSPLMCRNIRTLYNFKPPATAEEIRAPSLQFVRKLSGFDRPSKANELAFNRAVDAVAQAAHKLLGSGDAVLNCAVRATSLQRRGPSTRKGRRVIPPPSIVGPSAIGRLPAV
jgi:hypothetical protein